MDGSGTGVAPTARAIVDGVVKKAAIITMVCLLGAVVLQAALWPDMPFWRIPGGVLFGSAIGVLNFRWLALAVERVYLKRGTTGALSSVAAAIITVLKLSAIFIAIFLVIKWQLVNIFGLVAGLSCCFLAILWQGMTVMTAGSQGEKREGDLP
jgi:hypothetical protein